METNCQICSLLKCYGNFLNFLATKAGTLKLQPTGWIRPAKAINLAHADHGAAPPTLPHTYSGPHPLAKCRTYVGEGQQSTSEGWRKPKKRRAVAPESINAPCFWPLECFGGEAKNGLRLLPAKERTQRLARDFSPLSLCWWWWWGLKGPNGRGCACRVIMHHFQESRLVPGICVLSIHPGQSRAEAERGGRPKCMPCLITALSHASQTSPEAVDPPVMGWMRVLRQGVGAGSPQWRAPP